VNMTIKNRVGAVMDDVGASPGAAVGAVLVAVGAGFGLYKLVSYLATKGQQGQVPETPSGGNGGGGGNGATTTPPSGGIGNKLYANELYTVTNVTTSCNFRNDTTTADLKNIVGEIPKGTVLYCTKAVIGKDGYWWCQTAYGGKGGYVRTDKLKKVGL
jgi:hypothetical protein